MARMSKSAVWIFVSVAVIAVAALVYAFLNLETAGGMPGGAVPDPAWKAYIDEGGGYTLFYPTAYQIDTSYSYEGMGHGKDIPGVSFRVPESLTRGTNLSRDSYLSIERLAGSDECSALRFTAASTTESTLTEAGKRYSVVRTIEGAAGNVYEEQVYALPGSSPCTAVRYVVYSTNIRNYDAGEVIEFDRGALLSAFDTMRQSLNLNLTTEE